MDTVQAMASPTKHTANHRGRAPGDHTQSPAAWLILVGALLRALVNALSTGCNGAHLQQAG